MAEKSLIQSRCKLIMQSVHAHANFISPTTKPLPNSAANTDYDTLTMTTNTTTPFWVESQLLSFKNTTSVSCSTKSSRYLDCASEVMTEVGGGLRRPSLTWTRLEAGPLLRLRLRLRLGLILHTRIILFIQIKWPWQWLWPWPWVRRHTRERITFITHPTV